MSPDNKTAMTRAYTAMIPAITTGIRHCWLGTLASCFVSFAWKIYLHDKVWSKGTDACDTNASLCSPVCSPSTTKDHLKTINKKLLDS